MLTPNRISSAFSACGFELPVELGHHRERGVARHQPREQEVEGQRHPQREHEEAEAAERESHARLLAVMPGSSLGTVIPRVGWRARGPGPPGTRGWLLRLEVQQHLLHVGVGVGGRLGVRVARRGPAGDAARCCTGTSPPPRTTGMTGSWVSMTCSSWLTIECCSAVLVVRGVLVEQLVNGRVDVALVVADGRLADRGRVVRVEPVPQLVVRARAERSAGRSRRAGTCP